MNDSDFGQSSVAILGPGLMGRGIAALCLARGLRVKLLGRAPEALERARAQLAKELRLAVRRRQLPAGVEAAAGLELQAPPWKVGDCRVLIETVTEDPRVKAAALAQLAAVAEPGALVCTNTSALSVSELARAWPFPGRFLGLHFMNPAPASRVVELVPGEGTASAAVDQARDFARGLKLQVVEARDTCGFIVNRLLLLWINEAARMVEDGVATPQAIERAVRLALGHPMGPLGLADFIGLDTVRAQLRTMERMLGERYRPAAPIGDCVQAGDLGRKTGRGLLSGGGKA